ncbi:hypothetical protein Bca101_033047 [Brassica carinata]
MVVEYQEEHEYPPPNTFPSASCSDMTNGGSPCRVLSSDRLRLLCESHICKGVSVKSVAKILALADRYKATELKSVCLKFTAENLAAVLETDAYQQQKDECLSLQSELLKAVAGYEESSNSIAKSLSVWAQLSEGGGGGGGGGDTSSRHVRQRTT